MVTKVIHILTRSPGRFPGECPAYEASPGDTKPTLGSTNPGDYEHFIKISKFPHWIGFFQNDFHVKLAQEIVKTTDRYMVECWRFYWGIDKVYTKTISGIKHKLFPSKRVIIGKNYIGEISNQLIKELKEEIQEGKVIVHFHSVHKFSPNYILFQTNFKNTPLVVHNRGAAFPEFLLKNNPLKIFDMMFEKIYYKKIDFFISFSRIGYNSTLKKYGRKKSLHTQDGLDFPSFKYIEKKKARQILGIKESDKILLYIGNLYSLKGVDNILWAYEHLKKRDSNIKLYLIGGSESDELYSQSQKLGSLFLPRIPHKEIYKYYSAADISLYPSSNSKIRNFAGFSNMNLESLACNTPIYTSQLIHFLGTEKEKNRIGMEFRDRSTMIEDIHYMLENLNEYKGCREISKKYYNRKTNTKTLLQIYNDLENLYGL